LAGKRVVSIVCLSAKENVGMPVSNRIMMGYQLEEEKKEICYS
jgi:hypothetical protein